MHSQFFSLAPLWGTFSTGFVLSSSAFVRFILQPQFLPFFFPCFDYFQFIFPYVLSMQRENTRVICTIFFSRWDFMKQFPILIKIMFIISSFWFCKLIFIERLVSENLEIVMVLDAVTLSCFFSFIYNQTFYIFNRCLTPWSLHSYQSGSSVIDPILIFLDSCTGVEFQLLRSDIIKGISSIKHLQMHNPHVSVHKFKALGSQCAVQKPKIQCF